MKLRQLRRTQVRRWDKVHSSWGKVFENDHAYNTQMYPTRHIKPCKSYSAWCTDCNTVLFRKVLDRFPHSLRELDEFEANQQSRSME